MSEPAPAPAPVEAPAPAPETSSNINVTMCVDELNKIDATKIVDKDGKPDETAKQTILKQLEPLNKTLQEKMTSLGPKKMFGFFGGKKSKKSRKSKSKTRKTRR
jgi:hypothetical protein